jgi:predicted DNA-binding ribbon-helix-helix protein
MKSRVPKRSVIVNGHKSSLSVEQEFWTATKEIARSRDQTLSQLVTEVDASREHSNLSSALRLFVLAYYQDRQRSA